MRQNLWPNALAKLCGAALIFFTGTYDAGVPVSHVGIYVGHNRFIHCGDPISYASVTEPYWASHLYGYGRIS